MRILLVDDDPNAIRLYRTLLVSDGHEVQTVESGVEAVEAVEASGDHGFDVVVSDFNMPGIKGDTTLSLLRVRAPWLPVVILTSEASDAVARRAHEAGAAALLRKPCAPELLRRTLARITRSAG